MTGRAIPTIGAQSRSTATEPVIEFHKEFTHVSMVYSFYKLFSEVVMLLTIHCDPKHLSDIRDRIQVDYKVEQVLSLGESIIASVSLQQLNELVLMLNDLLDSYYIDFYTVAIS